MMLAKFRQRYPQGSLLSELVKIDRGLYIVKVSVQVENIILATAMASAERVETAEDAARERAIAALVLDVQPTIINHQEALTTETPIPPIVTSPTPRKPVNYPSSDDLGQKQVEIATQPSIAPPEIISEPVMPELSVVQPTEPKILETPSPEILLETPTIPNSGNLFASTAEVINNTEMDDVPEMSSSSLDVSTTVAEIEAIDFNDIKQKTDIEIKRLGWTRDDGRDFLQTRYGKRSRLHLTDEQLLEFLRYLEKLPTPVK
jgi:hypothetical protein